MKNLKIVSFFVLLSCLFFTPKEVEAQRRRGVVKVKRTNVVVHRKASVKPIRARRVAHHRYRHFPRWGKTVRKVGVGYVGIRFGGIGYRFHSGVWYLPKGNKFIVAKAPFGIRVRVLPTGHRRLVIGSKTYYYYYGTYYTKVPDTEEFEVIQPPLGAEVDALPDGYSVVKVNDIEYYKFECTYYEPRINDKNEEYYVVVECPVPV